MARVNFVQLIGKVKFPLVKDEKTGEITENKERALKIRIIDTGNEQDNYVLNLILRYFDQEENKFHNIPVTVWGRELSQQCFKHLKEDDFIYVQGELRYKYHFNKETRKREKVFTNVKASTIEFLSKKIKDQPLDYYMNEVKLVGNVVEMPTKETDGFVVAVDRLHPSKDLEVPNYKLTDYVHVMMKDKNKMKGKIQKGSTVIIDGSLMTNKMTNDGTFSPRIVVGAKEIVGR